MRYAGRINIIRGLAILCAVAVAGCIADPAVPPPDAPPAGTNGVLVVNEGLWRQDNSTLTYYDPASATAVQDYFTLKNPGLRLGDLGNSITVWNGRGYIAVTTSQTIEVVELATGVSLGRVRLGAGNEPRSVVIVDSATAYVTTRLDSVVYFDPMSFRNGGGVAVGPAPEGLAYGAGMVFVANSGLGALRRYEPGAGTIAAIDPRSGTVSWMLGLAPNPRVLHFSDAANRLYALYGIYDSTGGLVEIDPVGRTVVRRWTMSDAWDLAVDDDAGMAYVIGGAGVLAIDLNAPSAAPRVLIDSSDWSGSIFYSIAVSPARGDIYIGMTRGFTPAPAEVIIVDRSGALRGRFTAGIYPGDFAFY